MEIFVERLGRKLDRECRVLFDVKELRKEALKRQFGVDFESYFAPELGQLQLMAKDDLIRVGDNRLEVTARGRLLIRNLCKVFDHYRVEQEEKFSKMI